ncbi:hypothetical protein [Pseudomonas sp. FEN]|uniref:hypothetical protein n=1 Tax=Pseudomonas sp. FEN TaxID=2767468 RepID=UPI00174E4CDD|nr:hypothetical protein [Pseudomonas sp. FEN]CAD5198550.1 hypothetical protein [Pseudomonas sp. FEN]
MSTSRANTTGDYFFYSTVGFYENGVKLNTPTDQEEQYRIAGSIAKSGEYIMIGNTRYRVLNKDYHYLTDPRYRVHVTRSARSEKKISAEQLKKFEQLSHIHYRVTLPPAAPFRADAPKHNIPNSDVTFHSGYEDCPTYVQADDLAFFYQPPGKLLILEKEYSYFMADHFEITFNVWSTLFSKKQPE